MRQAVPRPKPRPESLADRILKSFEASTFDARRQDYLPHNCITTLITPESIANELKLDSLEIDTSVKEQFVNWILTAASKVFAITVECDLGENKLLTSMIDFQESNFTDQRLPIKSPRRPTGSTQPPVPTPKQFDPDIWTTFRLYNFYEKQWKYLAPVFSAHQYEYNLTSECIFPFTVIDKRDGGAFSSVYRVKIHPTHTEHSNIQEVAVKEIDVTGWETRMQANQMQTDRAWEIEARALESINKIDHEHIVKCIAAIRRGDSRYFMFPWADGDSLRDFWDKTPTQLPSAFLVLDTVRQLRGLADALDKLHNFKGDNIKPQTDGHGPVPQRPGVRVNNEPTEVGEYAKAESIRHGDLKPENILRFCGGRDGLGLLTIADMGLAKRHVGATRERINPTSMRFGTARYEAPETVTAISGGRSRLYDIWSMGCITFEFIIWLLHGNNELIRFYNQLNDRAGRACQYFEVPETGGPARVHRVVLQWMDNMQRFDPEFSKDSALRDLLHIVQTQLLVVQLPSQSVSYPEQHRSREQSATSEMVIYYRATARQFRDALDKILDRSNEEGYLLTGESRLKIRTPAPTPPSLDMLKPFSSPPGSRMDGLTNRNNNSPPPQQPTGLLSGSGLKTGFQDYRLPPLKDWEFPVDDAFAQKVAEKIGSKELSPPAAHPGRLCLRCSHLNFWAGGFSIEDTVPDLLALAQQCDFCRILYDICREKNVPERGKARFERRESTIILAEIDPLPVLSIFRDYQTQTPALIQLGFPELPQPRSDAFFGVIKAWLEDCDTNHRDCELPPPMNLPTRLIDVGQKNEPQLRLIDTRKEQVTSKEYVALSHPWGDPKVHPPFSTLPEGPESAGHDFESFTKAIPYNKLPDTFRDAVHCTRELGKRYLWIDSLCIIQGPGGDFKEESTRMEDVFSGAYCVLAASRATGQRDGFLGKRPSRQYVTFQRNEEQPFYVCRSIDDFSHHVLEGSLNSRGWVLQERALARRTIFFTEHQTYFECGRGVRCETLTTMHNHLADFLGDPKFPDRAMRTKSVALKVSYFQTLYQQYSRLHFTRIEDRPFAIAGLEKRLQRAFNTHGGFGIFGHGPQRSLFHRSLLWKWANEDGKDKIPKEEPRPMKSIVFPVERNIKVPSWSWMAYSGPIDYTDPPFETADWEMNEIRSPWSLEADGRIVAAEDEAGLLLKATVREYDVAKRKAGEMDLVFDTERTTADGQQGRNCVILARSKAKPGTSEREKRIYVLLVAQTGRTTTNGEKLYRRVGAGYMLGKFISLDGPGTPGRIC